jgi:hypothetical protein
LVLGYLVQLAFVSLPVRMFIFSIPPFYPVTIPIDYSDSQVPFCGPSFYPDPDYPVDSYKIPKSHGVTPMVAIFVIDTQSSDYQKRCWNLIFIYLPA